METGFAVHPTETSVRDRFRQLASEWKDQSRYLSNVTQMALLKSYQKIIGLGPAAVPAILEELQHTPDLWFWALEAITNENPVPAEASGRIPLMTSAWLEWGQQRGLI